MLRVLRCTFHRHCHHCHFYCQKCWCRIHLFHCLQSSRHPILCHLAKCIFAQVLKIFVGVMLVVVVLVVVVTYRILRHRCLSFCRFHKFIWKMLPIELQRQKFTVRISGPPWSTRASLRKPAVRAMLVLITLKGFFSLVLFCTFRIRQNWLSCLRF